MHINFKIFSIKCINLSLLIFTYRRKRFTKASFRYLDSKMGRVELGEGQSSKFCDFGKRKIAIIADFDKIWRIGRALYPSTTLRARNEYGPTLRQKI